MMERLLFANKPGIIPSLRDIDLHKTHREMMGSLIQEYQKLDDERILRKEQGERNQRKGRLRRFTGTVPSLPADAVALFVSCLSHRDKLAVSRVCRAWRGPALRAYLHE